MSIAGGVSQALERGRTAGCECVQIFTKSSRQWAAKPYPKEEIEAFKTAQRESGINGTRNSFFTVMRPTGGVHFGLNIGVPSSESNRTDS